MQNSKWILSIVYSTLNVILQLRLRTQKYLLLSAEYSTTEILISVRPATVVDTSWQLICGKWSDQLNTVCVGRGEEGGVRYLSLKRNKAIQSWGEGRSCVASCGATIAYFMWHNKMENKKSKKRPKRTIQESSDGVNQKVWWCQQKKKRVKEVCNQI